MQYCDITVVRVNILAMFPVIEEKYSVFTTKSDANCRVFVDVPYQIGLIPLTPKVFCF